MPEQAPVAPAPVVDLPVRTDVDSVNMPGSLKEMLSLARLSKSDQDPAPAPPAEPPAAPEPADHISRAEEALRNRLFQNKRKKPEAATPPAAPEPAPAPPATPEPAPAPAPAKAPAKRVAVKSPAEDYAERLERLEQQRLQLERERLELEKSKAAAPAPAPAAPASVGSLSDDERYEYEVFGEMDKAEPGKNYQKRFLASVEAAATYKAKWEKDNDGEAFNPEDSAHDAFFAKNGMTYNKGAFRKAEVRMAAPAPAKEDESTKREMQELRLKNALSEIQPRQLKAAALTIKSMLETVDKDLAKIVETDGAKGLVEKFPAKGPKIIVAANAVNNVATEAFRILETDGLVNPDLDRNPIHRLIVNIISTQEPLITAQPQEDQVLPDGRRFATWAQWVGMNAEQRNSHWHLGAEEVVDIFSQTQAARLKDEIDAINKEFAAVAPRNAPAPAPAPAPARPSPSGGSRSVIDTTVVRPPDSSTTLDKKLRSILFNRPS